MDIYAEQMEMFPTTPENKIIDRINKLRNQTGGLFKRINEIKEELIELDDQIRARVEFTESRMR